MHKKASVHSESHKNCLPRCSVKLISQFPYKIAQSVPETTILFQAKDYLLTLFNVFLFTALYTIF